jgi:hypothetical protein
MKNIRKVAILLLDDENGINESAFNELMADLPNDILEAIQFVNGRYFLNEDDAERLMAVEA